MVLEIGKTRCNISFNEQGKINSLNQSSQIANVNAKRSNWQVIILPGKVSVVL